jgi:hypothetical protein
MASPAAILDVLVNVDTIRALRTLDKFDTSLKQTDRGVDVDVRTDTRRALQTLSKFDREVKQTDRDIEVNVSTDTRRAMSSLSRYDKALRATDATTATATTRTSQLGNASRTTASRLGSAARWAGSAAAAYLTIGQAKSAITTTQDLAKTTAGLNRNLGFTVEQGSRWAAVAKSRDIDAKALTMSFTVLSRRLVAASQGIREGGGAAETAMKPFEQLGLTQKDVVEGAQDIESFMPKLADAFGKAEGGARRQASAQQLLGRGYATIVPMFADGAKGLEEQQKWADKYGTTLNQKTIDAQMKLVSAQRESKVAWVGLQMTFAQLVTPALQKANRQFQRLSAIMANDKLTNAEKWEKVGKLIGKWADKALQVFVNILPKLVEKAGEWAPKIAAALVEGFKNAPIWGKVALGAFLMSRLMGVGMLGMFGKIGEKIAKKIGTSIAARFGAAGFGTMLSNALAIVGWGPVGVAIATAIGMGMTAYLGTKVGPMLADTMKTSIKSEDIAGAAKFELGEGTFRSFIMEAREAGNKVTVQMVNAWKKADLITDNQAEKMKDAIKDVRKDWTSGWGPVNDKTKEVGEKTGDNLQGGTDKGKKAADDLHGHVTRTYKRTATETGQSTGKINKGTGQDMEGARKKGAQGAARLGKSVSGTFANMANAVGKGMGNIKDNLNAGLKSMKIGSLKWSIEKAQRSGGFKPEFQHGGLVAPALARGGLAATVPGAGAGDTHTLSIDGAPAAKVEAKEGIFVGNRNLMKRMAAMNAAVPRFAEGGGLDFALGPYTIPPIQYDANHAGTNSHWHISGSPPSWVVGIGKKLQQMGFMVGEHPAFGGVTSPNHAHYGPTDHWNAGAIDVNSAADETKAETARVAALLSGAGGVAALGGAVEKIARVVLKGPDSPLKDLGQKALDRAHSAANKYMAKQAPTEMAGFTGGGSAAQNRELGHRMLVMKPGRYKKDAQTMTWGPWGESEWPPYDRLIQSESGWSTTATNPSSGAYGIPQSLPGSKMATAGSDWRTNPATQIAWGLDYIRDPAQGGYGAPSNVPLGGYQKGGIVEWFKKRVPGLNIKDADQRVEQQKHILKHLGKALSSKGIDVDGLGKPLLALRAKADEAGLNVSNAFDLRPQGPDGDILDKNGMPILGKFQDKTELQWLDKQIQHLWDLRNALIRYEKQVEQRLKDVERMIKLIDGKDGWKRKAEKVLHSLEKDGKTPKGYKGEDPNKSDPKKWNSISDAKRKKARNEFERKGGKLAGDRFFDDKDRLHVIDKGRSRGFISSLTKISGRLGGHEDNLRAGLSTLGGELTTVQGASASKGPFDKPLLGVHGGELHTALIARKDLTTKPLDVTDSGIGSEASELAAELMAEQLAGVRRELALSQSQYGVFGQLGMVPALAAGGKIGAGGWALVGEQGPELAHLPSGAQVYPSSESQAMVQPVNVRVFIGDQELTDIVRVETDDRLTQLASRATPRGGVAGRKAGR